MDRIVLLACAAAMLATMAQADGPVSDVRGATRGFAVSSLIGGAPTFPVDPIRGQTVVSSLPSLPPNPVFPPDQPPGPIDGPFASTGN